MKKQRTFTAAFKAKVALDAIKGVKTMVKISDEYEVTQRQVEYWKTQAVKSLTQIFESYDINKIKLESEKELNKAYSIIGKLIVELDFLKKKFE